MGCVCPFRQQYLIKALLLICHSGSAPATWNSEPLHKGWITTITMSRQQNRRSPSRSALAWWQSNGTVKMDFRGAFPSTQPFPNAPLNSQFNNIWTSPSGVHKRLRSYVPVNSHWNHRLWNHFCYLGNTEIFHSDHEAMQLVDIS